jgi:hypothetical protein
MPTTQPNGAKIPVCPGMCLKRTDIPAPGDGDDDVNRVKPGDYILLLTDARIDGSVEGLLIPKCLEKDTEPRTGYPHINSEFLTQEFFMVTPNFFAALNRPLRRP